MADLAQRSDQNPILRPEDVPASRTGLKVECLLNPGVFEFQNKIWLLQRVAERPEQSEDKLSFPVMKGGVMQILQFDRDDSDLDMSDPREIKYQGRGYLSTMSHLRLASSSGGVNFEVHNDRCLMGQGPNESFGIEDCRVVPIDDTYYLTYTAVSDHGYGVGMMSTRDWRKFARHGMIICGPNKDCAIFEERIGDYYYCLHRPSMVIVGGNYIWLARSKDLEYWGGHICLAQTRPGQWDSQRIGAGAAPIKTDDGWLVLYHGADEDNRYCLGALLLKRADPTQVIARSETPIMEPTADYEKLGFLGNVIFTNGHIVRDDTIIIYYGASDSVICRAELSIAAIMNTL